MSAETTRNQANRQYFELRTELNRANRAKNLKTELEFEFRENDDEYFIVIKSTGAEHGLRIANKHKMEVGRWLMFENEMYEDFYRYMFLKICRLSSFDELNLNSTLTSWLVRLWIS